MKNYTLIFSILIGLQTWAQKNVFLNIEPLFSNQALVLTQNYVGNDGITVEIEHFNYYLSDIKLFHDNGEQTDLPTDIFLLTPTQHSLYLGFLSVNQIDSINFTIGVPKRYNTQAGELAQDISTYPETHPLSFQSPSMYWGWSFGYLHMIVGGKADSNNDNIPNAYFELHNFGNNNQQSVTLNTVQTNTNNQIDLNYYCHLDRWLNQMPLSSVGVLHGDTGYNQQVLQNVNTQTVFTLAANANIAETSSSLLSWIQTTNQIVVNVNNGLQIARGQLFSSSGQKILEFTSKETSASLELEQLNSGLYLLHLELNNGERQTLRFVKP